MTQTAFVFPGQGSQSLGMLGDLAAAYPLVLEIFEQASEYVDYDIWDLLQNGPEEKLNQTEYTQVAMLLADVAVFQILKQEGVAMPAMMAGHSLGEYAALVSAGAIGYVDATLLVSRRGQLMQQTIPAGIGAMAAIVGLEDTIVEDICAQASGGELQASPANYNAIGQVVIAGHTEAVSKAIALAEQQGARLAKLLPVSVPCHCALLTTAAEQFAETLAAAAFKVPTIPVISNVDLSSYTTVDQMRDLLAKQLYSPVRWVETIQLMAQRGITRVIECGPGRVLAGLIKRIQPSIEALAVYDIKSLEKALND